MCRHCREYRQQIEALGERACFDATGSDDARLAAIEAGILKRLD